MIDLSYLTEEEQEMILVVLRRDTELKKKEEQRIKKLKKTEQDKLKLKFLTGEWFYETKVSRHRDRTNGTDIIKNSMTQRKPVTILEVTQIWPEKPSFLRNETKDVFVPPELSGIIQEDNRAIGDMNREDQWHMAENKPSAYSQFKPRLNPFNIKPSESTKGTNGQKYTSENATKVPQITLDSHQSHEESPLSPAEDHDEDPCSSQVSEPHGLFVEQGKNVHLSPEGSLPEDDQSSANKVLGWCEESSGVNNKQREKLVYSEEQNQEGLISQRKSPKKENTPPAPAEIKIKPSPRPRRGLLALFSKQQPKVESPENVLTKENVMCPNDDEERSIASEFQVSDTHSNVEVDGMTDVRSSTSDQNKVTEEHEDLPLLFITEDTLDNAADEDIQQTTYPGHDEKPQNRMASLKSFWEKGNKGPKILSVKQGLDMRYTGMPTFSGNEVKISPSKSHKIESSEDMCGLYKDFPKSYGKTGYGCSFSPSLEKNMSSESVDAAQKAGEHGLHTEKITAEESQSSPAKHIDDNQIDRLDEIVPPVAPVRKTLVHQDTEPPTVSNVGSFWDKNCPKITISTYECLPGINTVVSSKDYSQKGINTSPVDETPANPNTVRGLGMKSQEVNEMTAFSKGKGSQNPTVVTLEEPNRIPCVSHDIYPLRPHNLALDKSNQGPISSLVKTISLGIQDSNDLGVSVQPRILSPRQMPKVPPRELYPITESRMVCSPMRAFNIDITPVKKIKVESLEHMLTTKNQTRYPHGWSHSEESSPFSDGNDLAKRMEQSLVSPSGNSSEHNQLRSPHSSSHVRKYQSPGNVSIDNTKYPSPVRRQKQLAIRPISISKSLEDLASHPSRDESWKTDPRSGLDDASQTVLPVLDPEKMKRLSMSVPGFLQQQGVGEESDCFSVDSFCSDRRRKSSTNTNFSASSGHASLSSVSGSRLNMYGAYFGHVEVKGTIQFAINYVNKLEELHIFIVRCRDLAAAEPKRNRSDPYVKCYLLPDKAKLGKKKTSVKKKTLNPTYNEILRYKIPLDSLKVHTLNLSVWHHDMFGRNSFLGEVDVDLSQWDINNTHMMDCELKGRTSTPSSPTHITHNMEKMGEMRVALRFLLQTSQSNKLPHTGEIQIWVKECKSLLSRRGTVDSFIKCSFLPDNNQKGRQKSRVVKKTANPVFNHTMVYDGISLEDLKEACVELTVWDHDRLSNHFIGGTRLGLGTGKSHSLAVNWMDSSPMEAELWKRMIDSVNAWVEDTLPLRMLIMTKIC